MYKNKATEQDYLFKMLFELNDKFSQSIKLNLTNVFLNFGSAAQYTAEKRLIEITLNNANAFTLIHEYAHSKSIKHDLKFLLIQSYIQYHYFKNISFRDYDFYEDEKLDFINFNKDNFKKLVVEIYKTYDFEDVESFIDTAINLIYKNESLESFKLSGTVYSS
ncbi:hypothetical protein [Hydrogenophaga sp.]|uniref:hypothetical protein n=1 Tax=Hydrogenophaga sp. TaxID=1904254 RepID=UPI0035AF9E3A